MFVNDCHKHPHDLKDFEAVYEGHIWLDKDYVAKYIVQKDYKDSVDYIRPEVTINRLCAKLDWIHMNNWWTLWTSWFVSLTTINSKDFMDYFRLI